MFPKLLVVNYVENGWSYLIFNILTGQYTSHEIHPQDHPTRNVSLL